MVAFVTWFLLLILSMVWMTAQLFPGQRVVRIAAATFYAFNFYQFSNWEAFRIGELSGAVLLPLMIGAIRGAFSGSLTLPRYALTVTLTFLLCMGVGVQPPVELVITVALTGFVVMEIMRT
jgi:hypothetical protein